MTVGNLLASGRRQLADQPTGRLEAEILLGEVLGVNRAWLYANPDKTVSPELGNEFLDMVGRRRNGEPIAYLTGRREFWSLPLKVTADVLIPRPETELLVETALNFIPADAAWRIADLGTGSGAIALALASERPLCEIHATEHGEAALAVARENAQDIAPGRVNFNRGYWLEPLDGRFQIIVSNPPYVAQDDPHLAAGDCRFEPREALTPGRDALAAIRLIAREAQHFLEPGGWLVFEHGFDQGKAVRELMRGLAYQGVRTWKDLEGRERVTAGQWNIADRS
jgi:release factor glutamine methyltransferase